MITIYLDSSNTSLTVAIGDETKIIDTISYEAWQRQSETMVPELDKILKTHNLTRHDIKDIVVAIGPGSYTGVRISITIAKVLSFALNCPIYPVSSLHVLKNRNNPSICVINARSGRSYVGVYENEKVIVKDTIWKNDEVLTFINEHPEYTLCGSAKHLGLEGYESSISEEMFSLKNHLVAFENSLSLKPVYLKD